MLPQYLTDDNKAAKMFREDFYATAPMLEIGLSEILKEQTDKTATITVKTVKRKMHELLFNEGMSAFKTRKATAEGKRLCDEMFPEFYQPMTELAPKAEPKPAAEKKTAPKKESAKVDKKKAEIKAPAEKKKSASAPGFGAAA